MKASRSPAHFVLVVSLLVLHFVFRPLLTGWSFGPDLLAGGLLLAALGMRAGYAAVLGLVLGLLEASMALAGMGTLMMVYGVAGFLGARSRDVFFSDSRTFVPTFLFIGVWLVEPAAALAVRSRVDVWFVLLLAPATAIATAIVCWIGERAVAYFLRT